ncbi:hypothetical protein SAMN05446635_8992 [Burkholderia sp. OK233]|nr:hypothetical protein SAMN05446635_8992 [Burkholderia sp. OK233]
MSSIETDGFLSGAAEDFRVLTRARFANLLRDCEAVSRRATTQVFEEEIVFPTVLRITAASLWARCVSACQGAILSAERGMGVEALALLRTAYEYLFFSAALLRQPAVISRLAAEDTNQRIRQVSAMLRDAQTLAALTDESREQLEAYLRNTPAAAMGISAFEAAEIAGMTGVYHGAWRTFSLMAAHATLTAAGHAFGTSLLDLRFGPSFDHVEAALGLARDGIGLGLGAVIPLYRAEQRARDVLKKLQAEINGEGNAWRWPRRPDRSAKAQRVISRCEKRILDPIVNRPVKPVCSGDAKSCALFQAPPVAGMRDRRVCARAGCGRRKPG